LKSDPNMALDDIVNSLILTTARVGNGELGVALGQRATADPLVIVEGPGGVGGRRPAGAHRHGTERLCLRRETVAGTSPWC
jgi:hypothetical protein